jgi:hypothetical protein
MRIIFMYLIGLLSLTGSPLFGQSSRPQEPKPPFNYKSEDVVFVNKHDLTKLTGTLTMPIKGKAHTAVILISGSGAQDRNSEIFGHKSFWVIADYLTNHGISVLRLDDRGVGGSTGNHNSSGLLQFQQDTEAAIDYLKSRSEIDPNKIGLIGHSLGGALAPIIASKDSSLAFIVTLAGPGIRGDKLMLLQKEIIERKMGLNDFAITIGQNNLGGAYEIIRSDSIVSDSLKSELKRYFTKVFGPALPLAQLESLSAQLSIPWLRDLIRYDPVEYLSKINCPVLAINGEKDVQVPAKENLAGIRDILELAENKKSKEFSMPNLNHLFQVSDTGMVDEYQKIEMTFSLEVLKIMNDWIWKVIE